MTISSISLEEHVALLAKNMEILVTNFKENDGKIAFMMKKTTTIASKGPVIFE